MSFPLKNLWKPSKALWVGGEYFFLEFLGKTFGVNCEDH